MENKTRQPPDVSAVTGAICRLHRVVKDRRIMLIEGGSHGKNQHEFSI